MNVEEIREGHTIRGTEKLSCDVVVVGSGAGGAVAADELAAAGLDVLVLEAGPWMRSEDFNQRELEMMQKIYVDSGAQGPKDGSVQILQGSVVGGSTVVNAEVCFRTPDVVLDEWATRFGVRGLSSEDLAPIFDHVEAKINVTRNTERYTTHAAPQIEGARKLGIEMKPVSRNVKGCKGCCYCFFGCAYGCKQSMDQSYIPSALSRGARVISEARVEKLHFTGSQVRSLRATTPHGALEVRTKAVVLSCGSMATPLLLQAHKLGGRAAGRNLSIHPVVFVTGVFEDDNVERPQAMLATYTDSYWDEGFIAEFGMASKAFTAYGIPGFGSEHIALRKGLGQTSSGGVLMRDIEGPGHVRLDRKGRKVVDYALDARAQAQLRQAIKRVAEINFAGGARQVYLPTTIPCVLSSPDELSRIDTLPVGPADIILVSYHPQGTARLGTVTDFTGRVRETDNLYVMDASLFPTPTGVNPQVSTMGVSTALSRKLAARLIRSAA